MSVGAESKVDELRAELDDAVEFDGELRERHLGLIKAVSTVREQIEQSERQLAERRGRLEQLSANSLAAGDELKAHELKIARLKVSIEEAECEARAAEEQREVDTRPQRPAQVCDDDILVVAERLGQFSAADIAAMAKITPKAATARVAKLLEAGQIKATDLKFRGKPIYEYAGLAAEVKAQESEALILVRDFVVKHGEKFTPLEITTATEVIGDELVTALQELLRMGTIQYVGFDDLELYEYVKATEPGVAAEKDMARRKENAQAAPRSAPVDGTGGKWKITNADVRALAQSIEAAGGKVEPAASGHYAVTHPDSKRRILISGTPSSRRSVQNDRARVRRELGLRI